MINCNIIKLVSLTIAVFTSHTAILEETDILLGGGHDVPSVQLLFMLGQLSPDDIRALLDPLGFCKVTETDRNVKEVPQMTLVVQKY